MLEKIYEAVKESVEKEIGERGFIFDGDAANRFIDTEIKTEIEKNCEDYEEGKDLYFDEILERMEKYMRENYKRVGEHNAQGIYVGYFYKNDCHFETVEELEIFFGIGE